jgi:predicted transcriptional regulator
MSVKEQVHALADQLSEEATWEEVAYEIYVRQSIEQGLADVAASRTIPVEEVKEYLRQQSAQRRARSLEQ